MSTSIAVAVDNFPCFITFIHSQMQKFPYICLFTFFAIITGKPVHTATKERMAPKKLTVTER